MPSRMARFNLCLALLLGLSAASAEMNVVLEWTAFDLELVESKDVRHVPVSTFAVHGDRIYFGLKGIQFALAWADLTALSNPPKLHPFHLPRTLEGETCYGLQEVRGLKVDSQDRLWVLDQGSANCPLKIWIFDLKKNDSVVLVHQLPERIVCEFVMLRWFVDLELDERTTDTVAYILDAHGELLVFSFKQNKSRGVTFDSDRTYSAIGISRRREQKVLYFSSSKSPEIRSVPVVKLNYDLDLNRDREYTLWGNKTAGSSAVLIDRQGRMYYDLQTTGSICAWDTNLPFKEEVVYKGYQSLDMPLPKLALDKNDNLWLLLRFEQISKRFKLLTATDGHRQISDDRSNWTASPLEQSQEPPEPKEKKPNPFRLTFGGRFTRITIPALIFFASAMALWVWMRKPKSNNQVALVFVPTARPETDELFLSPLPEEQPLDFGRNIDYEMRLAEEGRSL